MSAHNSPTRKIVFKTGARLEAMDFTHVWYPAKICRVNEKEQKALIHFEGWNHRYDEWISFDSDSLRPLSRGQNKDENKEEKEKAKEKDVCDYQDWKLGDRVLARWQDCKFYPAKITKVNTDGTYEVLFYDGFKKTVQRINMKPDHKVMASYPSGSEREKEVQDRQSRKAALANARAERARKRSKELEELKAKGVLHPSATVTRRKIKRPRLNDRDECGAASASSVSSPAEVPEVEEVMQEYDLKETADGKSSDGTSSSTSSPEKDQSVGTSGYNTKDNSKEFASEKVNSKEMEETISASSDAKRHHKSTLQETETVRTNNVKGLSPEKNQEPGFQDRTPESSKRLTGNKSAEVIESTAITMNPKIKKDDSVQTVADDVHDSGSQISTDVKSELQIDLEEQQRVDSASRQTNNESSTPVARSLEEETSCTAAETAKGSVASPTAVKNRLSPRPVKERPRLRIVPRSGHRTRGRGSSLGTRGRRNKQYSAKKPSRTSISPRGYGYSMAVMLPEKKEEEAASADSEKKTETNNNQVSAVDVVDETRDAPSLTKPKINTFRAKMKRLDQITGKLSAQRQSEADAALISPSAFQPTPVGRPTSPPQPPPHHQLSPNPQQHSLPPPPPLSSGSPLPVESFPPPLIYSPPMTAACCTNPRCHQHAAVYPPPPAHGPPPHAVHHVSHMHPHHEYPPGTSQAPYLMYSSDPRGPPGPSYDGRPCLASRPVYSHIHEAPPPTHESALARLIQCEQRIGYTSLPPHYRDGHFHGQWVGQPYMTLPQHEERWRPPLEITDRTSPPPAHLLSHQSRAQLQSCHPPVSQAHSHPHQPPPVRQDHPLPPPVPQNQLHQPPVSQIHPHPPQVTQTHTSSPVKQTHTSSVVQSHSRVTRPQIHTEETLTSTSPPAIPASSSGTDPQPQMGPAGPLPASVSSPSENPNTKQQNKRARKRERPLPTGFRTLECGPESFEMAATESSMVVKGRDKEDVAREEKLKDSQLSSPVVKETMLTTDPDTDAKHRPTTCSTEESLPVAMTTSAATELPTSITEAGLVTTAASYLGKPRRSKDVMGPAPKELVIEIDHNKFKCQVPGCDKSFRKASGLDYHMKYYHRPADKPLKRKRSSASARLDNVSDTSPEVSTVRTTKRRYHRSSAPGQLSSGSELVFESLPIAALEDSAVAEDSASGSFPAPMEISSPAELKPEPEVEIEAGTEVEPLELGGLMDNIELEEEEDEDEDVIRCLCNDAEDNGFMIQCEQCLTWQHSECVGLSEYTVPPRYLCYVCSNAKGLRKSAKYRNDFDWFKKGTLATFPLLPIEQQEYNAVMCKSTHNLVSDMHSVNKVLRSLRIKINILENPDDPELEKWKHPVRKEAIDDYPKVGVEETGLPEDVEHSTVITNPGASATSLDSNPGPRLEHVTNGSFHNGLSPDRSSIPSFTSNGKGLPANSNLAVNGVAGDGTGKRELGEAPEVLENTDPSRDVVDEPMSPVPALVPVGGVPYEDVATNVTEREQCLSKTETRPERTISSNSTDTVGASETKPDAEKQPDRTISSNSTRISSADETKPSITIPSSRTGTLGKTKPETTTSSYSTGNLDASEAQPEITVSSKTAGTYCANKTQPDRTISSNSTSGPGAVVAAYSAPHVVESKIQENSGHPSNVGSSSGEVHMERSKEITKTLLPPVHNLLDDICQIQTDMEARLDEIERQLEVLENAVDEPGTSSRKKPDLRKLVKDLTRVKLLALNAA